MKHVCVVHVHVHRTLSCTSFMQMLLCEGVVQAAVGVYKSRVVTSSHSSAGSTLQVFDQSDHSRYLTPLLLPSSLLPSTASVLIFFLPQKTKCSQSCVSWGACRGLGPGGGAF